MTSDKDRILKLEEEVAHLTMTNEELSSELVAQWKRCDELERKITRLENRFGALEDAMEAPPDNQRPPHW